MCRAASLAHYLLALLVASASVLLSDPARAQQNCVCEGSLGPQIQPFMMVKGDAVTIDLCYTNTAKVAGGIVNNVEVDLTGNLYARLACSDAGCLTEGDGGNSLVELPGTLTFDGCVASPLSPGAFTDVASCSLDVANHPNENSVLIQLDGDGLHITDNEIVCIARIEATATEPVPTLSGTFITRVATDPDGIVVAEPAGGDDGVTCANNGIDCGTNGTNSANFPPLCVVEVDKQVSCDGGTTFVDVGFGDNLVESCAGWNAFNGMAAEPIIVRYEAQNSGDLELANCVLTETNALIGEPPDPGTIGLGGTFSFEDSDQVCSEEIAADEPDTATISCECIVQDGTIPAMDSDTANFECQTPDLNVTKECVRTDATTFDFVITASSAGTAPLGNCVLDDSLVEGNADCQGLPEPLPAPIVGPTPIALPFDSSGNAAFQGFEIGEDSCNVARVTCDVLDPQGSPVKQHTEQAEAPCIPQPPVAPLGCRITSGGITPNTPNSPPGGDAIGQIKNATFGGQVGAPCGCIGCFDDLDSVQGEWTHSRKVRLGRFHASDYSSLVCDLDDGEGPLPRPAPANKACFAGVGALAENGGKREIDVAFRVEVEDRGEPGAGANSGVMPDVYRIRIWIPEGGEEPEDFLEGICCLNEEPVGVGNPDIDDGGDIIHGNIQIHPALPNTVRGICPPPEEVEMCFQETEFD